MEALLMQLQSACIVLLMIAGIVVRRRRQIHVKIMSIAMIWDVLLILQIELSRSAILKASKALSNTTALNVHVSIAVTTVILYAFMVYTGRALLAGKNEIRQKHKILGYTTFAMRVLTFITSFWAVVPKV
jgi:pyrimidine operon attenuation protein/uracil phosphoribosyltransferase